MDYNALADEMITTELGLRLKRLRERRGFSKMALAEAISQPAKAITALEKGRGTLPIFIAVLRQLRAFDQLDRFLLDSHVKALELADPRLHSEGTVMYKRRKSDFSERSEPDANLNKSRRKSVPEPDPGDGVLIHEFDHTRH